MAGPTSSLKAASRIIRPAMTTTKKRMTFTARASMVPCRFSSSTAVSSWAVPSTFSAAKERQGYAADEGVGEANDDGGDHQNRQSLCTGGERATQMQRRAAPRQSQCRSFRSTSIA